jgi:DNA polymerase kappa
MAKLETERELDRTWMHLDMDMFYAAVEIRDRPELADKPVAVGGMSMLSTANYVARKYGVRSAMAGFIAQKLCPQLVILPCNF